MHDLSPLVLPDEAEGEEDVQPEVGLVLVLEVAPEPSGVPRLEADHAAAQQTHHRPGPLLHTGGLELTILTSMHSDIHSFQRRHLSTRGPMSAVETVCFKAPNLLCISPNVVKISRQ